MAAMSATATPTGVLFLNMGDPSSLTEVRPFLRAVFTDREIMKIPMQDVLGPLMARVRTKHAQSLYAAIGGGSPLTAWNQAQLDGAVSRLDRLSPSTAPHRGYLAFRYTEPSTEVALQRIAADGIRRVVAFPQYPQYSCATSGSSLNELRRVVSRLGLQDEFTWSVIDRWYDHPAYLTALSSTITDGLAGFEPEHRDSVVVLFSAHSLPAAIVNRGDPYLQAIGTTVEAAMDKAGIVNRYALSYQSKVGPASWQGPATTATIKGFAATGVQRVLVIPVSFTSDHVETLSEIDIELAEIAQVAGLTELRRAPSLNTREDFLDALAIIAAEHLAAGQPHSPQYPLRCAACINSDCRAMPSGSPTGESR